jgi:hypothetical protein
MFIALESAQQNEGAEYPILPLYEESWSIATMKIQLEQFFVRTWGELLLLGFSFLFY